MPNLPSVLEEVRSAQAEQLQDAVRQNRQAYARMLHGRRCWDRLILTASSEAQAGGYGEEIALRRSSGLLPPDVEIDLIPDPPGIRPGSGGATFNVLRRVGVRKGERVLLLHCGGESRRLPAYGPLGKLFAPLPCPRPDGRASTVFDEILVSLSPLAARMGPGWLVAAADVLLLFRSTRLSPPADAVMGLGFALDAKTAQGHGVYVPGSKGRVNRFMQKPSVTELLEAGALSAEGTAVADTGVFSFPEAVMRRLHTLSADPVSEHPSDLYEDWVLPIVPTQSEEAYLSSGHAEVRRALWGALREVPLRVRIADPSRFVHLGSTAQWMDGLLFDRVTAQALGFESTFRSYVDAGEAHGRACILNSVVSSRPGIVCEGEKTPTPSQIAGHGTQIGQAQEEIELPTAVIEQGAVVEASRLCGDVRIRSGAAAVGVQVSAVNLDLPTGYALDQLPVVRDGTEGWVTRVYPIGMDPKATGEAVRLFDCAAAEWLEGQTLSSSDLWSTEGDHEQPLSLWNARLYPVAETPEVSLKLARWLLDCASRAEGTTEKDTTPEDTSRRRDEWLNAPRITFEECSALTDRKRLRAARAALEKEAVEAQTRQALERERDARLLKVAPGDVRQMETALARELSGQQGPLKAARAHWILSDVQKNLYTGTLAQPPPVGKDRSESRSAIRDHEERAFVEICRAVDQGAPSPVSDPRFVLASDEEVFADAPARLDLVGGWSDTPPYSLEHGGAVLNVAVKLDGNRPVRAWVRRLADPVVRFRALDLDREVTLDSLRPFRGPMDPKDPFALHKTALLQLNLIEPNSGEDFRAQLSRRGGGLELVTESAVPKGSGLGTSSILGGVALAALGRAVGADLDTDALCDLVLALEQRMTTGGGWQDQIGGLMGGWKVTRTDPGLRQIPRIEPLELSTEVREALDERMLLFYSGFTRIAKNILRNFVSQYLSRDARIVEVLHGMRPRVERMTEALRAGNLNEVGAAMERNNMAVASIDPQSWPPHVSRLAEAVRPHLSGAKPAGAGGGGFLILMAKSGEDRMAAEEILSRLELPPGARAYPMEVSEEGIRVTLRAAARS